MSKAACINDPEAPGPEGAGLALAAAQNVVDDATMIGAIWQHESDGVDPEELQMLKARRELVVQAIEQLPLEFREVIVLREFEELSYKEIAEVAGVPIGTVMSRLARARKRLQVSLAEQLSAVSSNKEREWRAEGAARMRYVF